MPTITISKKGLLKSIGKNLTDKELKYYISYLGTDLDGIEGDAVTVEIFPNRPDLLSEQGLGRALAAFVGTEKGLKKYQAKKTDKKLYVGGLPKEWPYALSCIVRDLKFDDQTIKDVIQVQEKLGVSLLRQRKKGGIGLYPLEKIKFPIKFTSMDPDRIKFRPLEYPSELTGREILKKHPTGRKYAHICAKWSKYPVFIDANNNIMSTPPVINSHIVGKIDETTKDVFVEITGNDMKVLNAAFNIMITALSDIGGKVESIESIYKDKKIHYPDFSTKTMKINRNYINKYLGLELTEKEVKFYLEKMGFGYEKGKVTIPCYRIDIMHEIDFAEDIAIAYGYDKFIEEIPNVSTIANENKLEILKKKIQEIMIGHGLIEVKNYTLSNKKIQNKNMKTKFDLVELESSLSEEYNVMRYWMMPCLMKTFSENKHRDYPQNIFETGTIFRKDKTKDIGVDESECLCVALCGENTNYTKIKQILESLFEAFGLKAKYEEEKHPSFIHGRVSKVSLNGKKTALIGEIHPEILNDFSLEMPVSTFEINLTGLLRIIDAE